MAQGMAGRSPTTGGPLRINKNVNPETGERYKRTIGELRGMQRMGQELNPMQQQRLEAAGADPFQRLSPGVYRDPQGNLRGAQGQMLQAPAPQPQQPQMPQGPIQFQPYGPPMGMRPTFPMTPGQGMAPTFPNLLNQLTPQQRFDLLQKQYTPPQQGVQVDMNQLQTLPGVVTPGQGLAQSMAPQLGQMFNRR